MLMTVSYFIWENGKVTHKQKQVFAEKRNDIKNQLIEEHGVLLWLILSKYS
jgi:hypothetical protein